MVIRLNGENREVADNIRLDALLSTLDIKPVGIAVEVNRQVIPRRLHPETTINTGDRIEIIRMVGGG